MAKQFWFVTSSGPASCVEHRVLREPYGGRGVKCPVQARKAQAARNARWSKVPSVVESKREWDRRARARGWRPPARPDRGAYYAVYRLTPAGRAKESRANDRRAIKAIRERRSAAPALIRELLSQLTSPTEDPSNG